MIPELAELLSSSVEECLEDKISVSFSGGLDSSLIAHLAKKHSRVSLLTAGTATSQDLEYAEKVAQQLSLPLQELIFEKEEIIETYKTCYELVPGDLLKVELLVPVYKIASNCKNEVLLFGSAAEELFVGYHRYYTYHGEGKDLDAILKDEFKNLQKREIAWVNKVCRSFDIEARFPFYNRKLAEFVFSIPLEARMAEKELKKGLLRDAAKLLGLPELARTRKKKAMQYGSGIHNYLLKHANELPGGIPKT
ncbi:MAG TPA: asparagine synthase C-terminal domain-containing protein [Candidatus Bilamarchaeaceae archaeon]|nr:asparagine synthase C-terminal domain-containing protein [Candidatus Bilamarchaeaceae archaeon]